MLKLTPLFKDTEITPYSHIRDISKFAEIYANIYNRYADFGLRAEDGFVSNKVKAPCYSEKLALEIIFAIDYIIDTGYKKSLSRKEIMREVRTYIDKCFTKDIRLSDGQHHHGILICDSRNFVDEAWQYWQYKIVHITNLIKPETGNESFITNSAPIVPYYGAPIKREDAAEADDNTYFEDEVEEINKSKKKKRSAMESYRPLTKDNSNDRTPLKLNMYKFGRGKGCNIIYRFQPQRDLYNTYIYTEKIEGKEVYVINLDRFDVENPLYVNPPLPDDYNIAPNVEYDIHQIFKRHSNDDDNSSKDFLKRVDALWDALHAYMGDNYDKLFCLSGSLLFLYTHHENISRLNEIVTHPCIISYFDKDIIHCVCKRNHNELDLVRIRTTNGSKLLSTSFIDKIASEMEYASKSHELSKADMFRNEVEKLIDNTERNVSNCIMPDEVTVNLFKLNTMIGFSTQPKLPSVIDKLRNATNSNEVLRTIAITIFNYVATASPQLDHEYSMSEVIIGLFAHFNPEHKSRLIEEVMIMFNMINDEKGETIKAIESAVILEDDSSAYDKDEDKKDIEDSSGIEDDSKKTQYQDGRYRELFAFLRMNTQLKASKDISNAAPVDAKVTINARTIYEDIPVNETDNCLFMAVQDMADGGAYKFLCLFKDGNIKLMKNYY